MAPPATMPQTERDKVESWRLKCLIEEGGYPLKLAEKLASRDDIDLHRAVALPRAGCRFETAAKILL